MKCSLSSRRKQVSVILGSKKIPLPRHDKEFYYVRLRGYCEEHCDTYAFIMHDKDIDEEGKTKFLHIHMALVMLPTSKTKEGKSTYKTLNTILNDLAKECEIDGQCIQIDEMTSEVGSVQYLIHKKDVNKTRYEETDVICSYSPEELHTIMESEDDTMSVTYLISVVDDNRCNRIEIMKRIGLRYYNQYRNVINDIINTRLNRL